VEPHRGIVDYLTEEALQNSESSYYVFSVAKLTSSAFANQRYSLASTNETYQSGGAFGAVDSNPFRQSQSFASMSPYTADPSSSSQLAAPAARGYPREQSPNSSAESGYTRPIERSPSDDPSTYNSYPSHLYSPDAGMYQDEDSAPILPAVSPEPAYIPPGQYSSQAAYENESRQRQPTHGRGVSLVDTGPVAHEPVRRTSKHQRRSSSRQYLASPISSSNTHAGNLPPGAVGLPSLSAHNHH
jgi:chitin synthase